MSKKEKVNLVRSEDFESMDDALNQAMSLLDETNQRIEDLLVTETERPKPESDTGESSEETVEANVANESDAQEDTRQ